MIIRPNLRLTMRAAYSIVELLVATLLTAIVMLAVVQIFASVSDGISDARAVLETGDRLRAAKIRLQRDLEGITVTPIPPRGETADGYLEIIEGPVMVAAATGVGARPWEVAVDENGNGDTTIGDFDDILMFTTRSPAEPFVGLHGGNAIESDVAEVAWFLRGRNLYRRVLLVAPGLTIAGPTGFYANNDISVHRNSNGGITANSLADLARRENRFAHTWDTVSGLNEFPYNARAWGWWRLPTLRECSDTAQPWTACYTAAGGGTAYQSPLDFWTPQFNAGAISNSSGVAFDGPRVADDLILTNVIGFDVKVFDPGYGDYVNLGYAGEAYNSATTAFSHQGHPGSGLNATSNNYAISSARVYDTWSTSYENDGIDQDGDGVMDPAVDGFDNNSNGVVDDLSERETIAPYPVALRGIQVKIRIFEPDSRQVREVTVTQDFSQ